MLGDILNSAQKASSSRPAASHYIQQSAPVVPPNVAAGPSSFVSTAQLQWIGGAVLGGFFQPVFQELTLILHMGLGRRWDLSSELENMKRKLAKVQAVIDDAERRRDTEHDVNYWVVDLRELIYNIDDTLGQINTQRFKLEQAAKSQDEVRDFFSSARDKAQEVQFKQTIKSKIKGFIYRLDEFVKEANDLDLRRNSSGSSSASSQARARSQTSPSIDESEVYGREKDKESIIELLFAEGSEQNKKNYDVIPIVGMGGLGKTTLAQLVFQDERVKTQFDPRSWACVSDIFDVDKVTKELVEYTTKNNCPAMSLAALQDRLENMVRGKRFFIVLDDIWTVEEWDSMKAPLSHCAKGSIILITTRDKAVANAIGNRSFYELGILDDEQCWDLFRGKAFGEVDADVDENLVQLGKGIVQKCKGVPLAVKVLGAMLQGAAPERWEAVLGNELWHLRSDNDKIFPALRLSYHCLPSPLKRCFEYFSLFPTDYYFRASNLVSMWVAEGIVEAEEGRLLEDIGCQYFDDLKKRCLIQNDDRIHDLLHNLACSISAEFYCRLQSDGKPFKSLARVRHASLFGNKLDEEQNRSLAEATRLRTMMLFGRHSQGLLEKFSEWSWLRVLKLNNSGISELPSSISNLKHLRYLDVSHNERLRVLPDALCELYNFQYLSLGSCRDLEILPEELGNLLNLRQLDLSFTRISSLPKSICKLFNLQVLGLDYCDSLAELPENIGDLHSLRKLDFSGSAISCVPDSIVKATNLQNLSNQQYSIGSSVPAYLRKLTSLQKLGEYPVRKESGRGIGELKDINNLRGRLVISGLENIERVEEAEMADMKSKKHITCLEFVLDLYKSIGPEDASVGLKMPHLTTLTDLGFKYYSGDVFPKWIYKNSFFSLTHLYMVGLHRVSRLVGVDLPSLQSFSINKCPRLREVSMAAPKLTSLEVVDCQEFKLTAIALFSTLQDETSVNLMAQLESLETDRSQLECLPQLQAAAEHHGVPLYLKELTIREFQNERTSFPMLRNLTSLESLNIWEFSEVQLLVDDDNQESFPSSLTKLGLLYCKNLTCLPKALRNCTSLKELRIDDCPQLTTFEEELLPKSITFLGIYACENVRHLPKDLYNLTSLVTLDVTWCPQIEVRPEDRLPPSLQKFTFYGCPKLEQQLEKGSRTDWPVLDFILKSRMS